MIHVIFICDCASVYRKCPILFSHLLHLCGVIIISLADRIGVNMLYRIHKQTNTPQLHININTAMPRAAFLLFSSHNFHTITQRPLLVCVRCVRIHYIMRYASKSCRLSYRLYPLPPSSIIIDYAHF